MPFILIVNGKWCLKHWKLLHQLFSHIMEKIWSHILPLLSTISNVPYMLHSCFVPGLLGSHHNRQWTEAAPQETLRFFIWLMAGPDLTPKHRFYLLDFGFCVFKTQAFNQGYSKTPYIEVCESQSNGKSLHGLWEPFKTNYSLQRTVYMDVASFSIFISGEPKRK